MQSSNAPTKVQVPFASSAGAGYVRTIPVAPQSGNAASFTTGFPVPTFTPLAAGGTPPDGKDLNGIMLYVTTVMQWQQAGFFPRFDATFAGYIGGYPLGAIVARTDGKGFWRSTAEANSTNPDTGGANWAVHGVPTVFGRTGPVVATTGDYSVDQITGAVADTDLDSSVGTTGWQKFPGGLIWQWGVTASIPEDTETVVTFPIAFPVACFQVQATADYGGHTDSDVIAQVCNITQTQVKIMRDSGGGSGYNGVVYWSALGH